MPQTPRERLAVLVRARVARTNAPALETRESLHAAERELAREVAHQRRMQRELPRLVRETAQAAAALDADAAAREAAVADVARLLDSVAAADDDAAGRRALAGAVVPATARAQQVLQTAAQREAYEDVMFQLRAHIGAANFDAVLRAIRQAARDQFVCDALLLKIRQAERA